MRLERIEAVDRKHKEMKMNRKLKIGLAAVGLAAAIGIGGLAIAGNDGVCDRSMMHGAWDGKFKAMAERRLEKLHDGLKLRADQEAAWGDFRQVAAEQAEHMAEKAKTWRDFAAKATAIERLERVQQGLDEGRVSLGRLTTATKQFYGVLDAEQQSRFDELTRHLRPGGFGRHAS